MIKSYYQDANNKDFCHWPGDIETYLISFIFDITQFLRIQ